VAEELRFSFFPVACDPAPKPDPDGGLLSSLLCAIFPTLGRHRRGAERSAQTPLTDRELMASALIGAFASPSSGWRRGEASIRSDELTDMFARMLR
jgi:hypothetical protein